MAAAEPQSATPAPTGAAEPPRAIIFPPPSSRSIIDKTATFVAKNGRDFEQKILMNEANNPKFTFLQPHDPYNAYYVFKIKEVQEKAAAPAKPVEEAPAPAADEPAAAASTATKRKPPPPDQFIAKNVPPMTTTDMDIIKLTAQFAAKQGQAFLSGLMSREEQNAQFGFLRPTHSLYGYFQQLTDQYKRILLPPKELVEQLQKERADRNEIIRRLLYKLEFHKKEKVAKQNEAEEEDTTRTAMAAIDWHDFVVVKTIEYDDEPTGPSTTMGGFAGRAVPAAPVAPPVAPLNVPQPVAPAKPAAPAAPAKEKSPEQDDQDVDMEVDEDDSMKMVDEAPVKIVKNYKPNVGVTSTRGIVSARLSMCPVCKQQIPTEEMEEHMRIELLDPRWQQQAQRFKTKDKDSVLASGAEMTSFLKQFAQQRSDIFSGEQDEKQKKKAAETEKREVLAWDGHVASVERTQQRMLESVTTEQRQAHLQALHKESGIDETIGPQARAGAGRGVPAVPPPAVPRPPLMQPPGMAPPPMGRGFGAMPPMAPGGFPGMVPMGMHAPPPMMPPPMAMPAPPMGAAIPPPPMGIIPPPPTGAPKPPEHVRPAAEEEPSAKRQKTAPQVELIAEAEFAKTHPGELTVCVQVASDPTDDKWNLRGQTVRVPASITDTIGTVKSRLGGLLGGMPVAKQKLRTGNIPVLRDEMSLAFYNITSGSNLQLSVKERGGRKR